MRGASGLLQHLLDSHILEYVSEFVLIGLKTGASWIRVNAVLRLHKEGMRANDSHRRRCGHLQ